MKQLYPFLLQGLTNLYPIFVTPFFLKPDLVHTFHCLLQRMHLAPREKKLLVLNASVFLLTILTGLYLSNLF